MRIVYIDVDALRPDHLGCYGYPRATSPTLDRLARHGVRFTSCYASDAPCLAARSAISTGRFGIHTGAVNHGGGAADPWIAPALRTFNRHPDALTWFQALREVGHRTASISSFPERHGAPWFTAGLHEWHDPGKSGDERAEEVNELALPWLAAHATEPDWFLHLNYWDPHTRYRTPDSYGNRFEGEPGPDWLDEDLLRRHREGYGPMSARDGSLYWFGWRSPLPWVPQEIATLDDFGAWIDAYDTSIRYLDDHLAQVVRTLETAGVLDDTMIIVSADHGESQGELNVYGDHQTADEATCHVPLIVRWPARLPAGQVDERLLYPIDLAATVIELAGGTVPREWDGRSFAADFAGDAGPNEEGPFRDHLVLSQMAWSCQRSVRFDRWLYIRTYHDGFKQMPGAMLFDVRTDPHQTHDLATAEPDVCRRADAILTEWRDAMLATSHHERDPLDVVLAEGGPHHLRGELDRYVQRLRATGRAEHAQALLERHGDGG
ncbi:MAG: sulfatase [Trueperaceae bacterium]|nr:sulfatase [Trueperaceae bacterium]